MVPPDSRLPPGLSVERKVHHRDTEDTEALVLRNSTADTARFARDRNNRFDIFPGPIGGRGLLCALCVSVVNLSFYSPAARWWRTMPLVVATLRESKAPAMGMAMVSARARMSAGRPGPSAPRRTAARGGRARDLSGVCPDGLRASGV